MLVYCLIWQNLLPAQQL